MQPDVPLLRPNPSTSTTSLLTQALRTVTADRKVRPEEWEQQVEPHAEKMPRTASAEARELVRLWAPSAYEVDGEARRQMGEVLQSRGYTLPTHALTGMVRRGATPEEAAAWLLLTGSEREWMLSRVGGSV